MYVGHHITCALLMSNFDTNWNVLTNFSKNTKYELHSNLSGGKYLDKCGQSRDMLSCVYKL